MLVLISLRSVGSICVKSVYHLTTRPVKVIFFFALIALLHSIFSTLAHCLINWHLQCLVQHFLHLFFLDFLTLALESSLLSATAECLTSDWRIQKTCRKLRAEVCKGISWSVFLTPNCLWDRYPLAALHNLHTLEVGKHSFSLNLFAACLTANIFGRMFSKNFTTHGIIVW